MQAGGALVSHASKVSSSAENRTKTREVIEARKIVTFLSQKCGDTAMAGTEETLVLAEGSKARRVELCKRSGYLAAPPKFMITHSKKSSVYLSWPYIPV